MANYWTQREDGYVDEWLASTSPRDRNRIFTQRIYPPLTRLASGIYPRYASSKYAHVVGKRSVIDEAITHVYMRVLPVLDSTRGKYYSLITRSIMNYWTKQAQSHNRYQSLNPAFDDEYINPPEVEISQLNIIIDYIQSLKTQTISEFRKAGLDFLCELIDSGIELYNRQQIVNLAVEHFGSASEIESALGSCKPMLEGIKRRLAS